MSQQPQYTITPYYTRIIMLPLLDSLIVVLALMNPDLYDWFLPIKTLAEGLCINQCLYLFLHLAGLAGGSDAQRRLREAGVAVEAALVAAREAGSSKGPVITMPAPDPFGLQGVEVKDGGGGGNVFSMRTGGASLLGEENGSDSDGANNNGLVSCCCIEYSSGARFVAVKLLLVKQFVLTAPAIALAAAIVSQLGSNTKELPVQAVLTLLVSVLAMTSLNILSRRLAPALPGVLLRTKARALQCIIVFGAVQNALVNLAVSEGAIKRTDEFSETERAARIKAFAQCAEMLLFALLFLVAFSPSDFASPVRTLTPTFYPDWLSLFNVFKLNLADDRAVWRKAFGCVDEGLWLLDEGSFRDLPVPAAGGSSGSGGNWGNESLIDEKEEDWESGSSYSPDRFSNSGDRKAAQKQRMALAGSLRQFPSLLEAEAVGQDLQDSLELGGPPSPSDGNSVYDFTPTSEMGPEYALFASAASPPATGLPEPGWPALQDRPDYLPDNPAAAAGTEQTQRTRNTATDQSKQAEHVGSFKKDRREDGDEEQDGLGLTMLA
eukprot:g11533.t1